jgi:hypothetical protein
MKDEPQAEGAKPKDESSLPAAEKTKKFNITYSGVTSTVAVVIALLSFYIANIREVHSLELGVVRSPGTYSGANIDYTTDLILLNRGNRTETLLSVKLFFPYSPDSETGLYSKAEKGPFVLKPGDAVPVQLIDKMTKDTFENGATWTGTKGVQKAELIVQLRTSAVSPNGQEIRKKIQLERIIYDEENDTVSFPDNDTKKQLKLIQLVY